MDNRDDLLQILSERMKIPKTVNPNFSCEIIGGRILDFIDWLKKEKNLTRLVVSLRDLLTWIQFLNVCFDDLSSSSSSSRVLKCSISSIDEACVHGAFLVILDGFDFYFFFSFFISDFFLLFANFFS